MQFNRTAHAMFTLGAMAILSASVSLAHASEKHSSLVLKPYIGAGMGMTWIDSNDDNLRPLMKGQYPNSHIIAGVNIGEYFGIEVGIDTQKRKNREHMYGPGTTTPIGIPIGDNQAMLMSSKLNMRGFDFLLTGFVPLNDLYPAFKNTQFFAGIGLSHVILSGNMIIKQALDHGVLVNHNKILPFKDVSTVPMARVGIMQLLTDKVSLRICSEWKQSNKLHIMSKGNANNYKLGLKNAFSAKISLTYSF
jgi:hypothetical protein